MTFASDRKLEVGTAVTPLRLSVDHMPMAPQPVFIKKAITLEEYLAETPQDRPIASPSWREDYYFYEVSTD